MVNIEFLRKKNYKFLQEIGQGGTGKTILIEDEYIDEIFICKKYSPYNEDDKELYYNYFIDEIKLLHTIHHKNIVRIFNYYLYPEQTTGYLLMEFIKGSLIDEFLKSNPDKLEDVFLQVIDGFKYLEEIKILHRDIRPGNILVSEKGVVKIIDFGFGKSIEYLDDQKSITLNWRYTTPNEFKDNIYDTKTEIYFIGKMFEEIILKLDNIDFKYNSIIQKMIINHENRISSFFNIYRECINLSNEYLDFNYSEKIIYKNFADNITNIIQKFSENIKYNSDLDEIIIELENLSNNSILEDNIQNNNKLIRIFIEGRYSFYTARKFTVSNILAFTSLLKSLPENKRKIVLNNLWERFDNVERFYEEIDDELPF